ncbi:MAG: hypothetical protein ACLT68_03460 [Phocaeicola coprophilus]|uniref:hypothetical protein n=1 Tax=Phocaeicola coprophilus TaxID=387090 RepID=UPI0002F7555B|nr:hypothetical protein [Phocaeicola coprophilus]
MGWDKEAGKPVVYIPYLLFGRKRVKVNTPLKLALLTLTPELSRQAVASFGSATC